MTRTMQAFFSFCGLRGGRREDQEDHDGIVTQPAIGLAALPRAMHPAGPRRTAPVDGLDLTALQGRAVPVAEAALEIADARCVLAMTKGKRTLHESCSDRYRTSEPAVDGGVQTPVQHDEQDLPKESVIKTTPNPINATASQNGGPPSGGPPQLLVIEDGEQHTPEKGCCDAGPTGGLGAPSPECEALLASIRSASIRRLCELTMIDEEGTALSESVFSKVKTGPSISALHSIPC
eukprot:Tamp_21469.p1 GENE.Tamp_21469~~Tamp_21469.p1  ORF type:complete len:258 (+),score=20.11 Tamp_21469:71-775(+)